MPVPSVTLKPAGADELSLDAPVYRWQSPPDWGESGFEVDLVEGTEIIGAARGASRQGPRQIVLPILIDAASGEDYLEAASALDAALSILAEKGGTIVRQTIFDDETAETELEIEVLSGFTNVPADWIHARFGEITATFTCQPRWLAPWAEVASSPTVIDSWSFEDGTTDWAAFNAATISNPTSALSKYGTKYMRAATPGAVVNEGVQLNPDIAITAGKTYTATAWVKAPVGSSIRIRLSDDLGTSTQTDAGAVSGGTWKRLSVTHTMDAAATTGDIRIYNMDATVINIDIDAVMLEEGSAEDSEFSYDNSMINVNLPALSGSMWGPGRVVIRDKASTARRFVELSGAFAHYDEDTIVEYRAADFDLAGSDGVLDTTSLTDRIGPNTISIGTLLPAWQTVGFLTDLPQVGTYRIRARVYCVQSEATVTLRYSWRSGAGVWREVGQAEVPSDGFYDLDLGTIRRYDEAETMTLRFDAKASGVVTTDFYLNTATISPTELYGVAKGYGVIEPATGVVAYDTGDQTISDGTALHDREPLIVDPSVGPPNKWVTSGATTDFAWDATSLTSMWSRSVDDGAIQTGRFALISADPKEEQTVVISFQLEATLAVGEAAVMGALLRYVNANNFVCAVAQIKKRNDGKYHSDLRLLKRVGGGSFTVIKSIDAANTFLHRGPQSISGVIQASIGDGTYEVRTGQSWGAADYDLAFSGTNADLELSDPDLGSGQVGAYGASESASVMLGFGDIAAYTETSQTTFVDVVREDGDSWITYEAAVSTDEGGVNPQPISSYQGRRVWFPPRKVGRISVKPRRGDSDSEVDTGVDDPTKVIVYHRPAYAHISDTLEDA